MYKSRIIKNRQHLELGTEDYLIFEKPTVLEIAEDPKVLDIFISLDVKYSQYEECRHDEMTAPVPQSMP